MLPLTVAITQKRCYNQGNHIEFNIVGFNMAKGAPLGTF